MKQVISGKGFEYGITYKLNELAGAVYVENSSLRIAESYFQQCSGKEQRKIMAAAEAIIKFLIDNDDRVKEGQCSVKMQSDQKGAVGDVRDIIVESSGEEIGISAKNRNFAVKNPRISDKIDFGEKWLGHVVSDTYWDEIKPIFAELREYRKRRIKWRDLPDKEARFYIPVLNAFDKELRRIYEEHTADVPQRLLHYLLGLHDFYKVTKINGKVKLQSFNINGTLKWGKKLPMPTTIETNTRKGDTTSIFIFNHGWQISFRIHNAETLVAPSLKFDVQIVGMPQHLSMHELSYSF